MPLVRSNIIVVHDNPIGFELNNGVVVDPVSTQRLTTTMSLAQIWIKGG